jgi:hypothetical protein
MESPRLKANAKTLFALAKEEISFSLSHPVNQLRLKCQRQMREHCRTAIRMIELNDPVFLNFDNQDTIEVFSNPKRFSRDHLGCDSICDDLSKIAHMPPF